MKERVNTESCLGYYLFADKYMINDLLDICTDFIQINTTDFLTKSIINNYLDINEIPGSLLFKILKFNYLSIPSESHLINIILDWMEIHKSDIDIGIY